MRADLNSLYDLIMLYKSKIDASDLQKMDVLLQYLEIKTSDCLAEKKELNDAYRRVEYKLNLNYVHDNDGYRPNIITNPVAKP
jgi:hypothetical protein